MLETGPEGLIPVYSDSEPAVAEQFYRKVSSTVVHEEFKEPDDSILNMRKEMPENKKALQMSLCTAPSIQFVF